MSFLMTDSLFDSKQKILMPLMLLTPLTFQEPTLELKFHPITLRSEMEERIRAIERIAKYIDDEHPHELLSVFLTNEYVPILIGEAVSFIEKYLWLQAKQLTIAVTLEKEDPEVPEWFLVHVLACGKWKFGFKGRFEAMVKVEEYLQARAREYARFRPEDVRKIREASLAISIFLGEKDDDCKTI